MLYIHACCKHMFQVFLGVSYVCLQVFHLDVAYVCNDFQMFFRRFRKCFRRLFHVFHLSSFVCYNCCIYMFQKYISYCTWDARGKRHGPVAGALAHEPDNARALTRSRCGHRPDASAPDQTSRR